jgi:hypothetical protein
MRDLSCISEGPNLREDFTAEAKQIDCMVGLPVDRMAWQEPGRAADLL